MKFTPLRKMKRETLPAGDLFIERELVRLEEVSAELMLKWQERAQTGNDGEIMPLAERFLKIEMEAKDLLKNATILAASANTDQGTAYDRIAHLIDKWRSLSAYCGRLITTVLVPGDQRQTGYDELQLHNKKKIAGVALRDSISKTVQIAVTWKTIHPVYGKTISRTSKFLVHDEYNQCKKGDLVLALATRPLSKKKHHSFLAKVRPATRTAKDPYQLCLAVGEK